MRSGKTVIQHIAAAVNAAVVLVLFLSMAVCTLHRAAAELQMTDHPALWGIGLESREDGSLVAVHALQQYSVGDEVLYLNEGEVCQGRVMQCTDTAVAVGNAELTAVYATDLPLTQVLGRCVAHIRPLGLPVGNWLQKGSTNAGLLAQVAAGVLLAELPIFLRSRAFCELEDEADEED